MSVIPRYSPPRQRGDIPTIISNEEDDYDEEIVQGQYTDEDVYGNYNNYDEDQYQYQYQEGEGDNYVNTDGNVTSLSSDSNISFLNINI